VSVTFEVVTMVLLKIHVYWAVCAVVTSK